MRAESIERRRYPRINSRIPLRYRKIRTDNDEFQGSLSRDISAGGMRIRSYEFLARDTALAVEISLFSDQRPAQGIGRVAWVKKTPFGEQYDLGVEFINFPQQDQEQFSEFILGSETQGIR